MPGLLRVAVLWNSANPSVSLGLRDTRLAADKLGINIEPVQVREPKDFSVAFTNLTQLRPEALVLFQDALTLQHRKEIIDFVARARMPTMYTGREWVREGGFMSYGENLGVVFHRAAYFVDKIFKGTKPADLPVEQPTEFDLVINLKTAEALGITFPQIILLRADEVID